MDMYLPYIVSIVCALISGIASYLISRKQMKTDLEKLNTQYKLDIEKEREKFLMEKEKMELEHKYELERQLKGNFGTAWQNQQKEFENQLGGNFVNTMITEAMKMPEVRQQITQGMSAAKKKR